MSTQVKGKGKGYFAKDEDYGTRMDAEYAEGEQFVILEIHKDEPFVNPKTDEKIDSRTKMLTRKFDPEKFTAYGIPVEVKTLSGPIFDRLDDLADGDFPAVVSWQQVEVEKWNTKATVLRRVCAYPVPDEFRQYATGEA